MNGSFILNPKRGRAFMPTYRKVVLTDLVMREKTVTNMGEFRVSASPVGFRRGLTIFNRELTQYFAGTTPRFKINIIYSGNRSFNMSVFQLEPEISILYSKANIASKCYSTIFEVPYLRDTGKHIYVVKASSGVDSLEKTSEIIYFNVLDFDVTIFRITIGLLGALAGFLPTYFLRC